MTALVSDILDRAADRLSKPGAFTTGTYARDASGKMCAPGSPNAICFCFNGAVAAELGLTASGAELWMWRNNVPRLLGIKADGYTHSWSDKAGQAEVVAKLREAAAKARSEGK